MKVCRENLVAVFRKEERSGCDACRAEGKGVEQFELAAPGKDFEPYTENRLYRVAPQQG